MESQVKNSMSWILKDMLKVTDLIVQTRTWNNLRPSENYPTGTMYREVDVQGNDVIC